MPTNREIFFAQLNEKNKYLTRLVIKSVLNDANGFYDDISLYKNFDLECPNYEQVKIKFERIKNGEPFQYVLGYANFIDSYFEVNPNCLIPRHETEELVISLKGMIEKYFGDKKINVADVCSGSGCIGISIKKYFKNADVILSDISDECVELSKKNAANLGQNVQILKSDLLSEHLKKDTKFDVLISNPPYIEDESTIDEQVWKYEPHLALLAKPDTYFYEKIFKQAQNLMKPNCILAFEIGEDMQEKLGDLVEQYFPTAMYKISKDMYNKIRFLYIIIKEDMNYA